MRILHSIHSLNPEGGGPAEFLRQLVPLYNQQGHESAVVSMDDPKMPFIAAFPGQVYALGASLPSYGFSPQYVPWLRQVRQNFDAVIVHGLWQYPSRGAWTALHGTETPYLIFPHGMLDPWFETAYPLKHLKKTLYWKLSEHKVLRDAHCVLFTAEQERLNARKSFHPYQCNEVVVGLGSPQPSGNAQTQRSLFLDAFPLLQGKQVLLFLGRLHEKKGCGMLLDAFSTIAADYPELYLVMAGPDTDRYATELKTRINNNCRDRVIWTGMLSGDLKWGALHAANALILPSHQENYGVAVSEALSCDTPVLISNKVNIWEDIVQDGAGLADDDTLQGTHNLMKRWLKMSKEQQDAMQLKSRQCFIKRFEISNLFCRLNLILGEAINPSVQSGSRGD